MLLLITFVKPQALEVGFLIDGSYSFFVIVPIGFHNNQQTSLFRF